MVAAVTPSGRNRSNKQALSGAFALRASVPALFPASTVEIAAKDPAAAGYTLRDDGTVWAWTAVPASWATAAPPALVPTLAGISAIAGGDGTGHAVTR